MKSILLFFLFTCQLWIITSPAQAQPGRPDSSFADNGTLIDELEGQVETAVVSLPDKKLLIGGAKLVGDSFYSNTFRIDRLLPNGKTDLSYGNGGRVVIDLPHAPNEYYDGILTAMLLLPDGKILAAGNGYTASYPGRIAIARVLPDGTPDSSFGINGGLRTGVPYFCFVNGIALQPDGKFLLSGQLDLSFGDFHFFVERFLPDGGIDSSFGAGGTVISTNSGAAYATIVAPDGKIISAGIGFHLEKLNSDGSYDNSFGTNGMADGPVYGVARDIALQPDGKILAAGRTLDSVERFTVVRYTSSGAPDTSFGEGGIVFTSFCASGQGQAVKILESDVKKGRIVVAGSGHQATNNTDLVVVNYLEDGSLNPAFGTGGIGIAPTIYDEYPSTAVLQSDGKYVVAGNTIINNAARIVVRFDGYASNAPLWVKIKRWLNHHTITWNGLPESEKISRYIVEQSDNPNTGFKAIYTSPAISSLPAYSIHNDKLLAGNNYYRIKAIAKDGSVQYSQTASAVNTTPVISVQPNPAVGYILLNQLPAGKKLMLYISDATGVNRMMVPGNGGTQQRINVGSLTPGTYYITVICDDQLPDKLMFFKR